MCDITSLIHDCILRLKTISTHSLQLNRYIIRIEIFKHENSLLSKIESHLIRFILSGPILYYNYL